MKKITLELTDDEFNALQQLMDAGVRASGMGAVRAAAHLLGIFEKAATTANAEAMIQPTEEGK